jgi:IS30 family transposase
MEQKNCSIKKRGYTHLTERERYKLEALLEAKKKVCEIARILRRDRSTIYKEKRRGSISRLQSNLSEEIKYRANVAQADYEARGRNKERSLKIGKDKALEAYIRVKLIKERFSPDAILGEIKAKGLRFKGIICTKTLYNYIDAGLLSGISNKNLWQKKRRKKRGYKAVSRVNTKNRWCRSIEDRPKKINNRLEYGHWEGDTIKGPQKARAALLTLTERKTREEIIIKVRQTTQEAIKAVIDGLEAEHRGNFKVKFKSITFDNGVEFLGWESLEVSSLKPASQRMTVYFAHSYSSWERGSNENQNRMIRRFIPKGTDITDISDKEIRQIQDWMNNYPRKILGYKTANQMVNECLQSNSSVLKLKNVSL